MVKGERVIEKQVGPICIGPLIFWSQKMSPWIECHIFYPIFFLLGGESLMMVKGERVIEKQIGPIDPDWAQCVVRTRQKQQQFISISFPT